MSLHELCVVDSLNILSRLDNTGTDALKEIYLNRHIGRFGKYILAFGRCKVLTGKYRGPKRRGLFSQISKRDDGSGP